MRWPATRKVDAESNRHLHLQNNPRSSRFEDRCNSNPGCRPGGIRASEAAMLERTLVGLATLSAFTLGFRPVQAQSTFKSGYYAITGGLYTECCGIAANTFSYELPDERLGFVGLIVDPGGHTARLTFLSPDLRTVFTSYPWFPEETFAFSFNNGIVYSNYIQFGEGSPAPSPELAEWNYTVRDQRGALSINGVATAPVAGADVPNQFTHTNVVAALVLNPIVIDRIERDGDSMRFHFTGQQ